MRRWASWCAWLLLVGGCEGKIEQLSDVGAPSLDAGVGDAGAGQEGRSAPGALGLEPTADRVLDQIEALEVQKDVTCWSSFRQLDFFIASLKTSDHGSLAKVAAMKRLTRGVWVKAGERAQGEAITREDLAAVMTPDEVALSQERKEALGEYAEQLGVKTFADYRKTSEHWRVLLAVVQDEIRRGSKLKALTPEAEELMADRITQLSLELLVKSGELAGADRSPLIEAEHVRAAYEPMAKKYGLDAVAAPAEGVDPKAGPVLRRLTKRLIDVKIKALYAFNDTSGSLVDDTQLISKVPLDAEAVEEMRRLVDEFSSFVTSGKEPMRADNFLSSGSFAKREVQSQRDYIDMLYVENTTKQLFPYVLVTNGDVLLRFEPNPGTLGTKDLAPQEVRLLDHQMNAVRDTAVHWVVMRDAFERSPFAMDPFAGEILSEVNSTVMTLYLRRAQTLARQEGAAGVTVAHVRRVNDPRYVMVTPQEAPKEKWGPERQGAREKALGRAGSPRFREITEEAGLPTKVEVKRELQPGQERGPDIQVVMGAGVALGDVNQDGYPDVYMGGEGLGRLYVNKGKAAPGRFEDATARLGVPEGLEDGRGSLFFDKEGDGDLDLLILRSREPSLLLEWDGGRFRDVAKEVGFAPGRGAHVASVLDVEGDGDLDVYVGFYGSEECNRGACEGRNLPSLDGRNGTRNQLWRREADGRYTEIGVEAGVADEGWALAVGSFDAELDGDLDLYVANDFGPNAFLLNQGGGKFVEVAQENQTADRGSGMNVSFTDANEDGRWDLYVSNIDMFSKNIKVVFPVDNMTVDLDEATLKSMRSISGNKLFVSRAGAGGKAPSYEDQEVARLEPMDRGWAWAAVFFDLENDGDEDLYLSNGWIEGSYASQQRNQLYVKEGEVWFHAPEPSRDGGVKEAEVPELFEGNSRSVAAADFDGDGDVDLLVNNFRQAPRMLENVVQGQGGWIKLRLRGAGGNTRAVGALVTVEAGGRKQLRQVTCGQDYLGQQDEVLHLGLGSAEKARVTVKWPDGREQVFDGLKAKKTHELRQ